MKAAYSKLRYMNKLKINISEMCFFEVMKACYMNAYPMQTL